MHAEERERLILEVMQTTGFMAYRGLEATLRASPATIRRDLARLEAAGKIVRIHGGAKLHPKLEQDARCLVPACAGANGDSRVLGDSRCAPDCGKMQ